MSHVDSRASRGLQRFDGQRRYRLDVAALRPSTASAVRLHRPSRALPASATR